MDVGLAKKETGEPENPFVGERSYSFSHWRVSTYLDVMDAAKDKRRAARLDTPLS